MRKLIGLRAYVNGAERDWIRDMGDRALAQYGSVVSVPARLLSISRVIRASIRVAMRHPDEVLAEVRADAMNAEEDDE